MFLMIVWPKTEFFYKKIIKYSVIIGIYFWSQIEEKVIYLHFQIALYYFGILKTLNRL